MRRSFGIPVATPLAVVVTFVSALLAARFPLTGTPGPEAAQILSTVASPFLFIAAATRGARRHDRGYIGDLVVQLILGALCFAGFLVVILLAGVSHKSCAPDRGVLPFFLLSAPPMLLSSTAGLVVGRVFSSRKVAAVAALTILAADVAWLFLDWIVAPSFRVFTHMFFVVPGDMLAGQALTGPQVGFRFATLVFAFAFAFVGVNLAPASKKGGGFSTSQSGSPMGYVVAIALFVLGFIAQSSAVGHAGKSLSDLDDDYALVRQRGALIVRADARRTSVRHVDAVLAEGTLWLERLRVRMGVAPSEDITVWLHADAADMAEYTGARHVHFALPSRNELHITGSAIPHPTLGHELVHVLGRQLNDGIFGVPTQFLVLIHAGIVEGTAMALTPELETRDGLTLREQAAALRRAQIAPPLSSLFDENASMLGFWRHAPGRAYATAGALMESLVAERGVDGLAKVYEEGTLRAAFDSDDDLAKFIEAHEMSLDRMELPRDAVPSVKVTFARPSILDETCDEDRLLVADEIRGLAQSGDFDAAIARAQDEEHDVSAKTYASIAQVAKSFDDERRHLSYLKHAADATPSDDVRGAASALQLLGDALWESNDRHAAIAAWERIEIERLAPYPRRLIEARLLVSLVARSRGGASPLAESAMRYLLRSDRDGDDVTRVAQLAMALPGVDEKTREDVGLLAFARYLVGRQAVQRGALDDGVELLLLALERPDTLPLTFEEEAMRALAVAYARRGQTNIADAGFAKLAENAKRAAHRIELRDRRDRVTASEKTKGALRKDVEAGDADLLGIGRAGGI